jgi:DNA-binding NtrC family response regulator
MLLAYPWPGNVREMQNTVERAVILADSGRPVSSSTLSLPVLKTTVSGFAPAAAGQSTAPMPMAINARAASAEPFTPPPAASPAYPEYSKPAAETAVEEPAAVVPLHELEKQAILAALRQNSGNRTQASAQLQISIRTLRNKIQEYRESGETIPGGDD